MEPIKLNARVGRDRRLSLQLPADVAEGEVVEVIVRTPAKGEAGERPQREHLEAFLRRLAEGKRARLSKEEIDAYLAEERASWER
jgi:RNase H-fold protein (predicted Holliday junction resolvase)